MLDRYVISELFGSKQNQTPRSYQEKAPDTTASTANGLQIMMHVTSAGPYRIQDSRVLLSNDVRLLSILFSVTCLRTVNSMRSFGSYTSGAIYSTVPTGLMATSCFMLMVSPKSPSFTRPSPPMKMFSSLISLHLHVFLSLLQQAEYIWATP